MNGTVEYRDDGYLVVSHEAGPFRVLYWLNYCADWQDWHISEFVHVADRSYWSKEFIREHPGTPPRQPEAEDLGA